MQDDFDNGMGLPDDELTGGSAISDMGEAGGPAEPELDITAEAPGRPSGGARARKSAGARRPTPRRAAGGARKSPRKAKRAKKKSVARKTVKKKTARRAGRKKR